jgi:hypothetical protein
MCMVSRFVQTDFFNILKNQCYANFLFDDDSNRSLNYDNKQRDKYIS